MLKQVMLVATLNSVNIKEVNDMARQEIYKTHPLVFYEDDKDLYETIKKVSKSKRMNLRGYILLAVETFLGEESIDTNTVVQTNTDELNSIVVNGESIPVTSSSVSSSDNKWGNW